MTTYQVYSRECSVCGDGILVFMKDPGLRHWIVCTCCSTAWPSPEAIQSGEGSIVGDDLVDYDRWLPAERDDLLARGWAKEVKGDVSW
jgi:hypothetical protein